MNETERILALAALLHDIGKIRYRAGVASGTHGEQGKELLASYLPPGDEYQELLMCLACHHATGLNRIKRPDHLAYLVYEADNISAGTDRRTEGEDSGFDMTAPLESVFVRLNGHSEKWAHYLRGLDAGDKINYPVKLSGAAATADKYTLLLTTLESNFRQTNFATCSVNEILKIMEAVTAYIPSSTSKSEACDISLYDHSRLTAALASSMLLYFRTAGIDDYRSWCVGKHSETFRETAAFLLVEGDMSGIQNFIYTIPSSGALKSLRGRSFYLEALLEHIADEILTAAGLSRANLLYTGGGHFCLLAPNTQSMRKLLEDGMQQINDWMLRQFGTSLYLQIAWQPASANDFMNKQTAADNGQNRSGNLFRKLSGALAAGKMRRYSPAQLSALFSPDSMFNKTEDTSRECSVCHTSSVQLLEADGSFRCPQCHSLYLLGEQLLKGGEVIAAVPGQDCAEPSLPALNGEQLSLRVLSLAQAQEQSGQLKRIYVKNKMKTGSLLATNLWVGDYAARHADRSVQDFSSLAAASSGIRRLAVLRADVDDLGAAFIAGFEQPGKDRYKYVTLSRYAALSRQLSLFFKHYINGICRGELSGDNGRLVFPHDLWGRTAGPRRVSIVYSGGDDIFIVGAWDEIIGLAVDLREVFSRYTCGRLTLSAGIAFFPPAYPVAQMAKIAGQLEEEAKAQPNKDSVALFGLDKSHIGQNGAAGCRHIYSWDVFIRGVIGEKLTFLRQTLHFEDDDKNAKIGATGKLPAGKGLLYRLLQLVERDRKENDAFRLVQLVYWLARLEPQKSADSSQQRCYHEFRNAVYAWYRQEADRRQLATALQLIIYGLRDQKDE